MDYTLLDKRPVGGLTACFQAKGLASLVRVRSKGRTNGGLAPQALSSFWLCERVEFSFAIRQRCRA